MDSRKHSRVTCALLDDRLDSWFYKPEFVSTDKALQDTKRLGFCLAKIAHIATVGYGFMPTEDYWSATDGAPFLRVTNITASLQLDVTDVKYVNPHLSRNERYRLNAGDILVVQCGNSTGRVGYIGPSLEGWVFPSFSLRVGSFRPGWDSGYVAAFLASGLGQRQLQRTISITSVRPNTTKPAVEQVQVVRVDESAQKCIGDKVRQAERLRKAASYLDAVSEAMVASILEGQLSEQRALEALQSPLSADEFEKSITSWFSSLKKTAAHGATWSRVVPSLLSDRLYARHYRPEYLRLGTALRQRGAVTLDAVTEKIECGPFGGNAIADDLYEKEGLPFIRPVNLSGSRLDMKDLVRVSENRLHDQGLKVYSGENLYFARVGTPSVAMFGEKASISPNVIIAKGAPITADVGYLYCFCRSQFGIQQLEQELKEGVQPTTSTDTIRRLQVVLPHRVIQEHVGRICRRSMMYSRLAIALTNAARLLVEALIKGDVSEAEVAEAQFALGRGDRTLDQAILSRLTEDGVDFEEKSMLFDDPDVVYAAIKETPRSEHSSGDHA